jgi:ubiquinone/menaquinone biosynthesis C-methylase UbiE
VSGQEPRSHPADVSHPLFARFFAQLSRLMERELAERRRDLLAGLSGRVLEVGAGNGMNFRHYPHTVDEVVALEPEPYLRAKAERAARTAPVRVSVRAGTAYPLPFEGGSFDAAVTSLVLCSVPEPDAALAELRRALKADGELRFMEHVRSEQATMARLQRWADRSGIWPRLAGGCHCARNTVHAIASNGFRIEETESFGLGPAWGLTHPHVLGRARTPATA